MHFFFDTEFTGLTKTTDLISIGIISETGRGFYAIFTDYDINKCDKWIINNVISNLETIDGNNITFVKGNKSLIRDKLTNWLKETKENEIVQFVSDVSHYDFVLLIDALADYALDLPNWICPYCHDINQDIAKYYKISDFEAFDKNRESIVKDLIPGIGINDKNKHNAYHDAEVIQTIYLIINRNTEANTLLNFKI